MMVLQSCNYGDLRAYLNKSENCLTYESKMFTLFQITRGLLDIHNAGRVHGDFHSGHILFNRDGYLFMSNLRLRQPENEKNELFLGIFTYMAPEVLREYQYTTASDIYSFGIIANEFLSEETP